MPSNTTPTASITKDKTRPEAALVLLHIGFSDEKRSISVFIYDYGRGFDVEETLTKKDPLGAYGLMLCANAAKSMADPFISNHKSAWEPGST